MVVKKRTRKSKKWISRLFFLLLLVAAVVLCYFVWDAYFRDKTPKPEEPKPVETSTEVKKEEEKKEEEKPDDSEEKPKVPQYEGEDPNKAAGLTGAITYAGVSNGYLRIRVNIDQYLTSGSCNVVLTRSGTQIFSDYANLVASASTSTCEGFDIPTASLGAGSVQINVIFSSGDRSGSASGEANI